MRCDTCAHVATRSSGFTRPATSSRTLSIQSTIVKPCFHQRHWIQMNFSALCRGYPRKEREQNPPMRCGAQRTRRLQTGTDELQNATRPTTPSYSIRPTDRYQGGEGARWDPPRRRKNILHHRRLRWRRLRRRRPRGPTRRAVPSPRANRHKTCRHRQHRHRRRNAAIPIPIPRRGSRGRSKSLRHHKMFLPAPAIILNQVSVPSPTSTTRTPPASPPATGRPLNYIKPMPPHFPPCPSSNSFASSPSPPPPTIIIQTIIQMPRGGFAIIKTAWSEPTNCGSIRN